MIIDKDKIEALKELLNKKARITVLSHVNPDGDAIGSSLAWTKILNKLGHEVRLIVPNNYPYFLNWMTGIELVHIYKVESEECEKFIERSDIIFCLDFNMIERLEGLGLKIAQNTKAKKVLIDHHLMPPNIYDIQISYTKASSTSYLIYELIMAIGCSKILDRSVAESLYVGISTDTGNFTFSSLTPELFRAVAHLIECGIDTPMLNIAIYSNFSADRMRLLGYVLDKKMVIIPEKGVAYMALSEEELKNYNFRQGDSEGFVNMPLSISNVNMSAMFIQNKECVKISLRSQGDFDVNKFAREHFNGGGHKNAAGGKSFQTLEQTIEVFINEVKHI